MNEAEGETKSRVERAFETTFKLLFGECNVTLDDLAPYLVRGHYQVAQARKSAISGKAVVVSTSRYPAEAKYISQDEIDFARRQPPISINEIKDIDSIISAFGERFTYAGNKSFGNCAYVEESDNCTDSFYIYKSHTMIGSKYAAYSSYARDGSECAFGSSVFLNGKHVIRFTGGHNVSRIFESYFILNSADIFASIYCLGCSEMMFSFNQRNRKCCIGNIELPRDRYLSLKGKLVEDSRHYIEKHKSFPSIFNTPAPTREEVAKIHVPIQPKPEADMAPIEKEFEEATRLILGVPLSPLKKFKKFLMGNVEEIKKTKSPFGNDVLYSRYFWAQNAPKERMITTGEAQDAAKARIDERALEDASLGKMLSAITAIAYYPVQFEEGQSRNGIECEMMYYSSDCYRISDPTYSKKCAYCTHVTNCEAVFGSGILMTDSSFSLRCNDCMKVSLCMDMDGCKSCHRCMFCHNCEGLSDCMFCFNVKNLKYAVGNVEVGREEYMRIRQKVVDELLARLQKTGDIGIGICSIGARKSSQ
jgi:hypothetical protein